MFSLFGNRKKIQLPEEERMQNNASSFSFAIGDTFQCNVEEVRLLLKDRQGYIVLLIPSESLLENPRGWIKALCNSSYIVVYGNEKEKKLKRFLSLLDRQIFSPIPKLVSGAICLDDQERIKEVVSALPAPEKCITIISR